MPPVPVLRPQDVIKTFEVFGWEIARQHGSHIILKNWSYRDIVSAKASDCCQGNTPQPHHTGRFDHRRVLRSVCRLSSSLRRL